MEPQPFAPEQTDKYVAGKQTCCYIEIIQIKPLPTNRPWRKKTIEIKKAVEPIAAEILIGKRALPVEIKRV